MEADLSRIAELSRIYFSPDDLEAMQKDMASIMDLMDSLRGVELPGGGAPHAGELPLAMLREDAARPGLPEELLTSQAPGGGGFELPRVVE